MQDEAKKQQEEERQLRERIIQAKQVEAQELKKKQQEVALNGVKKVEAKPAVKPDVATKKPVEVKHLA